MSRRLSKQEHIPLVVVAGGAGFFGSHLCESLLQSGVKVVAIDDLVTGSVGNLAAIKHHPHFEFIECNINQGLPQSLTEMPITHVVHAAGVETHGEQRDATLAMALTGAFGTKNLLDLAAQTGARFLLISTLNIYEGLISSTNLSYYFGSSAEQEARFSQQEAKRYAEGLCELYSREYSLDARVARVSQLYGPRMDLRRPELLPKLMRQVLADQSLQVDVDSTQPLLLTYIADAVYGISRLLFAEDEQFRGSIYNFANPEKVSVISVAYTLREFLSPGKEVQFLPVDKQNSFASPALAIDRTKRDLGWEPTVNVTEGLKLTVEAFKKEAPPVEKHLVTSDHLRTGPEKEKTPLKLVKHGDDGDDTDEVSFKKESTDGPTVGTPGLKFRGGGGASAQEPPKTELPKGPAGEPATTQSPGLPLKSTHWWRRLLFGAAAVLIYAAVGRPLIHTVVLAAAGGIDIQRAVSRTKSLHFDGAQQQFALAGQRLRQAGDAAGGLNWVATVAGQSKPWTQLRQGLSGTAATTDGLATLCQAAAPLMSQAKHLAHFDQPASDSDFGKSVAEAQKTVAQAKQQLAEAEEILSKPEDARVAGMSTANGKEVSYGLIGGLLDRGAGMVGQVITGVGQLEHILTVLPGALGDDQQKTYLVMLENSNELRPTGGFMGSYALIKVSHGRIADFKIDDIYNPDGQLHTSEAAPAPLAGMFKTPNMTLRDANWSPDASTAGQQVADLYQQATNTKVDGVMFVTTQAVKPILQQLGSIWLSSYQEKVTADNFDLLAQKHSDIDFTPGSTAKKDFLGQLFEAMVVQLRQNGQSAWIPVVKGMAQGLETREIQIYAANTDVQDIVEAQGWAGTIKQAKDDYLRVVDANIGSNKANMYVQRSEDYSINIDRQSQLHGTLNITWKHSGKNASWPGGNYIDYVRIYVPAGSVLKEAHNFDDDNLDVSEESGKTVFGGKVSISYNSQKTVSLSYDLPSSLALPLQNGQYDLLWQKQSGIVQEPLQVTFNTPAFLKNMAMSAGAETDKEGGVVWSATEGNDAEFSLKTASR